MDLWAVDLIKLTEVSHVAEPNTNLMKAGVYTSKSGFVLEKKTNNNNSCKSISSTQTTQEHCQVWVRF